MAGRCSKSVRPAALNIHIHADVGSLFNASDDGTRATEAYRIPVESINKYNGHCCAQCTSKI